MLTGTSRCTQMIGDDMEGVSVCGCGTAFWPPLSPQDLYGLSRRGRMDRSEGRCGLYYSLFGRFFADGPPWIGGMQFGTGEAPTRGPAIRLVFLGFELETMAMEVRLPAPKLQELKESGLASDRVKQRSWCHS